MGAKKEEIFSIFLIGKLLSIQAKVNQYFLQNI
jgi:hypothetical protein